MTPLFREVPDKALEQLAFSSKVILYSPGEFLVKQDEPGDALYLVIEGTVSIIRDGLEITRRDAIEYIGEIALIDDAPRSATVAAVEPTKAIRITRDNFWSMIEAHPSVARHLLRLLCARIRQDTLRQIEAIQDKIKRERDLERAAEIQRSMLPSGDLKAGDLHISGVCILAETVGGDYFDYISLPDGRACCIIADGRGHGMDAALLAALVRSALHTQIRFDPSPESVMNALERVVMDAGKTTQAFATCCYVLFENDKLHYVNAGHPFPILYRGAEITELKSTNLCLGWSYLDPSPYDVRTIEWSPGDGLLMYSDGVTDTEGPENEFFEFERLSSLVVNCCNDPPPQLSRKILHAVEEFRGNKSSRDDITLVIAKRHPSSRAAL